jgi:hypothetical protein
MSRDRGCRLVQYMVIRHGHLLVVPVVSSESCSPLHVRQGTGCSGRYGVVDPAYVSVVNTGTHAVR